MFLCNNCILKNSCDLVCIDFVHTIKNIQNLIRLEKCIFCEKYLVANQCGNCNITFQMISHRNDCFLLIEKDSNFNFIFDVFISKRIYSFFNIYRFNRYKHPDTYNILILHKYHYVNIT